MFHILMLSIILACKKNDEHTIFKSISCLLSMLILNEWKEVRYHQIWMENADL